MAIWEVAPAPCPFLDTNGFAKKTYVCSLQNTKRDCYELLHKTAAMDLQAFDAAGLIIAKAVTS